MLHATLTTKDVHVLPVVRVGACIKRVVTHGLVRIQYTDEGQGPVIVVLPSLGRGAGDYDEFASLLVADGFRVVRPQPRGIEGSQGPINDLSMVDLANDVAAVVKVIGPAVIAGHAFGNFVARMLATMHPGLVKGVALLAASAGKTEDGTSPYDPGILEAVIKSGDLNLPVEQRLRHLQVAFFAPGNDPSPWLIGWFPDVKAAQVKASETTPVDAWFSAGTAPILDLQAEFDTVAPQRLSNFLSNALGDRVTRAMVRNAGHALIPEQPVETARILADWVRSNLVRI